MDNAGAPTPTAPSLADSNFPSEVPAESEIEDALQPKLAAYPPYSQATPGPPSVADTIMAGHKIRVQHKSVIRKPAKPFPRPARPWGPKATDVKMTAAQTRRHLACMRRHGAILTDRLERMSKPKRRTIIYFWREKADILTADTIARLRTMLDADEPFKPDQAYEYFVNLRKTRKKVATMHGVNKTKKDLIAVCGGKKFMWARNATVAFARGIQQRLARPGKYALADEMLRLSNIVLEELCDYMDLKVPSRRCNHPKSKFMLELSDKIAVWIDEILAESEDRMLMMDFDEDADVLDAGDSDDDFADHFLNMMSGGGPHRGPKPAYLQFGRDTLEAFNILTDKMYQKNNEPLYEHGKNSQTYKGGADELKSAESFKATHFNSSLANEIRNKFQVLTQNATPGHLQNEMKNVIDLCSNYLTSEGEKNNTVAESSKYISKAAVDEAERGPAFNLLINELKKHGGSDFTPHIPHFASRFAASQALETAPGLKSLPPDQSTKTTFQDALHKAVDAETPTGMRPEMKETIDRSADYLSGLNRDRDKVLDLLVRTMNQKGNAELSKRNDYGMTYKHAAQEVTESPILAAYLPVKDIADEIKIKLNADLEGVTPADLKVPMKIAINDAANLLSQDVAVNSGVAGERYPIDLLSGVKKSLGTEQLVKHKLIEQTFAEAAETIDRAGTLTFNPKSTHELSSKIKAKVHSAVPTRISPGMTSNLTGAIDKTAKHIAKVAEEQATGEKRQVPTDIVGQKESNVLSKEDDDYQMTHSEGAKEILVSPVEKKEAMDTGKQNLMEQKVAATKEDKQILGSLKETLDETAAHLTDGGKSGVDEKPEGKPMLAPDVKPMSGPNGERTLIGPDGKPYNNGADGKPVYVGADEKSLGAGKPGLSSDGKPLAEGKPMLRPEGKPILGPDGKSINIGADGKPVHVAGAGDHGAGEAKKRIGREGARGSQFDQDLARAIELLHRALELKGAEVFYQQPFTQLTHRQALECLRREETRLEQSLRGSADTIRLAKKFEKKLNHLVDKSTPSYMRDVMQDVVIEAAAKLAIIFVNKAYREVAKEGLIQEMQRQGNKILIELDGLTETFFFAAQRLKNQSFPEEVEITSPHIGHYLTTKMDEVIKCRNMPRKLFGATKEHIRSASNYLSELVTKPDARIEAYVSLLNEMEGLGNKLLIEREIQKSYKDAAAYLRELTTFKDQINKSSPKLDLEIQSKLQNIMSHVEHKGYTANDLKGIINEVAPLLVSYIVLEGERTNVLKAIIEEMKLAGDNVLLRHGIIRKSYNDAVVVLKGKNTDQMVVQLVDPIVARKIQTKLKTVMEHNRSIDNHILSDVIQCAADYLAVRLLQAQTIKVCQCMKNEFVQCELWTDEILRRVTRPCCSCSRHASTQALSELVEVNTQLTREAPNQLVAPGLEVTLAPCPAAPHTHRRSVPCPAAQPQTTCPTNFKSYLMYGSVHRTPPPKPAPPPLHFSPPGSPRNIEGFTSLTDFASNVVMYSSYSPNNLSDSDSSPLSYHTPDNTAHREEYLKYSWQEEKSIYSVQLDLQPFMSFDKPDRDVLTKSSTTSHMQIQDNSIKSRTDNLPSVDDTDNLQFKHLSYNMPSTSSHSNEDCRESQTTRTSNPRNKPGVPIISTDQMTDWHAMIVSLMWNVQAWREWIQENVNTALDNDGNLRESKLEWDEYQKRVTVEAIQWRQYNIFSQQLTMRLAIRYKDKEIVSPTRATVKTEKYQECQQEMIKIIEMFNRWTHWLLAVVKETDSIKLPAESSDKFRWKHYKDKILTYADDWIKYNLHLKVFWEEKYRSIVSEWLPSWQWSGPVWVVSTCGAVPSGAVSAGLHDGEVIWVARTTHKNNVLPAALHPSKHCCLVYDEGSVYYYNKYQVMCNAEVVWVRWRAGVVGGQGGPGARAVRAARGVHVGRVQHRGAHLLGAVLAPHCRCHVSIFGKHFAFSTYELLVLADDQH